MKKIRRHYNELDYWDTLADAMLALFLCILLIVLLFILYFVQLTPDQGHIDDYVGDNTEEFRAEYWNDNEADDHHYDNEHDYYFPEVVVVSGGGDSGGGYYEPNREEPRERTELPRTLGDAGDGEKSAVFVELVDGETLLPLVQEGIKFELYDDSNRLQTLNDYYPIRVEHTNFETTEEGSFYLPEKIFEGDYSFHCLTDIDGYGPAEDTAFRLGRYYDWEEPYHVTVKAYPLRCAIRIQLSDKDTGVGIGGSTFKIIAAENVTTLDGTVRFREGEIADTVVTNSSGYVETRELYLGTYFVRQEVAPEYYGLLDQTATATLTEATAYLVDNVEQFRAEKTTMVLTVRDALYDNLPVADAEFQLLGGTNTRYDLISDVNGQIVLTNLQKNTTYRVRQTEAAEGYRIDSVDHAFAVDGNGMIQGQVRQEMVIENRVIRASFRVSSTLLSNRLSDVRMELTDSRGNFVKQWTTSGMDMLITGLDPGTYYLIIDGNDRDAIEIYISDEANLQNFHYTRWTLADTGVALLGVLFLLGAGVGVFIAVRRRKTRAKRGMDEP